MAYKSVFRLTAYFFELFSAELNKFFYSNNLANNILDEKTSSNAKKHLFILFTLSSKQI